MSIFVGRVLSLMFAVIRCFYLHFWFDRLRFNRCNLDFGNVRHIAVSVSREAILIGHILWQYLVLDYWSQLVLNVLTIDAWRQSVLGNIRGCHL